MKYVFLFLFLLPMVSALAVTPTSLDFGELERGASAVREVLVVNTETEVLSFRLRGFQEEEFKLEGKESRVITLSFTVGDISDGSYDDVLYIEEVYASFSHGVAIPVQYYVKGGDSSDIALDLAGVNVAGSFDMERLSMFIVLGGSLLGVGLYGWRRRKKLK
jgi:hypothetical protein